MSTIPPTRRKKTPVRLYLPPNLELTELSKALTGTENSYSLVKKVCLLYTYIISKGFNPEKVNDFGASWTQVKATVMKAIFGRMYSAVVERLLNNNYLERLEVNEETGEEKLDDFYRSPRHREGGQAKQFCIPDWLFDNDEGKKFVVAKQPMGKADLNKVAAIRAPKRHYAQDASRRHVEEMMRSVVLVDTPECRAVITGLWEGKAIQVQPEEFLEVFNHGTLNEVIVDEFGQRMHSQLTRRSKKLRPFQRFADDLDSPLVEIDIISSQPAILASITPALIARFAPECGQAVPIFEALQHALSFRRYQDICFYEDIYAYLARKWNEQYPLRWSS